MKYGYNVGHGEVKVSGCDNHALAHDLLRINILIKDTVDHNKLSNVLGFQIHGFTITFYLMFLEFDDFYTMAAIKRFEVPRSMDELATFLSLKNFTSLSYVCEIFWSNCSISENEALVTNHHHPTRGSLYQLIDGSRSKHRTCSLRFEV